MAYCSVKDIRLIIPEIFDEEAISNSIVKKFISKAENIVNARLRDTYVVPFDSVPDLIKDVTAEYASYLVMRTVYAQNTPNSSEYVEALKESAEDYLTQLSKGELTLDAAMKPISIEISSENQVFSMESITPYAKD